MNCVVSMASRLDWLCVCMPTPPYILLNYESMTVLIFWVEFTCTNGISHRFDITYNLLVITSHLKDLCFLFLYIYK